MDWVERVAAQLWIGAVLLEDAVDPDPQAVSDGDPGSVLAPACRQPTLLRREVRVSGGGGGPGGLAQRALEPGRSVARLPGFALARALVVARTSARPGSQRLQRGELIHVPAPLRYQVPGGQPLQILRPSPERPHLLVLPAVLLARQNTGSHALLMHLQPAATMVHEFWPHRLLTMDRRASGSRVPSLCQSVRWRSSSTGVLVLGSVSDDGLRSAHLPRKLAGHRSMPSFAARQTVSQGVPWSSGALDVGGRQLVARLAHLCGLRPSADRHRTAVVRARPDRCRSGSPSRSLCSSLSSGSVSGWNPAFTNFYRFSVLLFLK